MIHTLQKAVYQNPVRDLDFPDPFILKYRGEYWAICTGIWKDGRAFGMMHSHDLVHWSDLPGALERLESDRPEVPYVYYWAPEIYQFGGRFYLYYCVGNETYMTIRVATADHPSGPYRDSGHALTSEQFAIDAHVFRDDDGQHYLFYATDFLEHTQIGTGTVVDRFVDPFTLEGRPRPVTRAKYDWQVYDPVRKEKGGVRWHTVEGPFVLKRKGVYYEMFSGGNWQNTTYGVSYATTHDIRDPSEWKQHCDGVKTLPILRTVSTDSDTHILGPGHNSVVRGPSNFDLFCVYHRWNAEGTARVLCIDRMDWTGDELIVLGPTTQPQPIPSPSHINDTIKIQGAINIPPSAHCSFDLELATEPTCIECLSSVGTSLRVVYSSEEIEVKVRNTSVARRTLPLTLNGFIADNKVNLTVRLDHRLASISVEGLLLWNGDSGAVIDTIVIDRPESIAHFEMSHGWENDFEQDVPVEQLGYTLNRPGLAVLHAKHLELNGLIDEVMLTKEVTNSDFELTVNVRAIAASTEGGSLELRLSGGFEESPALRLDVGSDLAATLSYGDRSERLPLAAETVRLDTYSQVRIRKVRDHVDLTVGTHLLGTFDAPDIVSDIALHAQGCSIACDMIRFIHVPSN